MRRTLAAAALVAGVLGVLGGAACSTPSGDPYPEPAEVDPAVDDVELGACTVSDAGTGQVEVVVVNHTRFRSSYSVEVRFRAGDGEDQGAGQVTVEGVDGGATKEAVLDSRERFTQGGTCEVDDVTRFHAD
jgi:hypothetical protein